MVWGRKQDDAHRTTGGDRTRLVQINMIDSGSSFLLCELPLGGADFVPYQRPGTTSGCAPRLEFS